MGEEKAKRLAKIQERWEKGEYENATVIHVWLNMEDFVRLLSTDEGDIYHITLSEDTILFSQDTLKIINGVKVVGIDLRRLQPKV